MLKNQLLQIDIKITLSFIVLQTNRIEGDNIMQQYLSLISLIFCFIFQITTTQAQPIGIPNFQEALEACSTLDDSSITSPVQIKVIFVVEKGSHNYTSNTGFDPYGNDHFALIRTHHVRRFFDDHRTNECFSWSMITFKGSPGSLEGTATASISNDTGSPTFTKDYDIVDQAINNLSYIPDDSPDSTTIQYGSALQLAGSSIRNDLRNELREDLRPDRPDKTYYFVFFITGASPSHLPFRRYPLYEYTYKEVESIANIKPGMIFFSTAYYGANHLAKHTYADGSENLTIPNIMTILQTMADAGRGRFFNLERGETLDLNLISL